MFLPGIVNRGSLPYLTLPGNDPQQKSRWCNDLTLRDKRATGCFVLRGRQSVEIGGIAHALASVLRLDEDISNRRRHIRQVSP